jgi:restriction endonuclease S subunit
MVTGTTRASVTITQQENLELIIPSKDMQKAFVKFVKQSDKSKLKLQNSLAELSAIKYTH